MALYDPRNDTEVVERLERIMPDLIWLAQQGLQPSLSGGDYIFLTVFGYGERGNVHGCGPDLPAAVKALRGVVMAEILDVAA